MNRRRFLALLPAVPFCTLTNDSANWVWVDRQMYLAEYVGPPQIWGFDYGMSCAIARIKEVAGNATLDDLG